MLDRDVRLLASPLVLRPTEPADAQRFFEIQSNWNVTRMLRLAPWPATLAAMEAWLPLHLDEWAAGTAYRFAVTCEGRVIGCADIDEIAEGTGDFGYWLEEASWGRGFGKAAARAVIAFGFEVLGLRALTAGHAADNAASGHVLRSLGFTPTHDGEKASRSRGEVIPYRFLRLERG